MRRRKKGTGSRRGPAPGPPGPRNPPPNESAPGARPLFPRAPQSPVTPGKTLRTPPEIAVGADRPRESRRAGQPEQKRCLPKGRKTLDPASRRHGVDPRQGLRSNEPASKYSTGRKWTQVGRSFEHDAQARRARMPGLLFRRRNLMGCERIEGQEQGAENKAASSLALPSLASVCSLQICPSQSIPSQALRKPGSLDTTG